MKTKFFTRPGISPTAFFLLAVAVVVYLAVTI